VWHELTTSEAGTLAKLKTAGTPEQAARIFSEDFERPSEPMLANREQYAREAYSGTLASAPAPAQALASLGIASAPGSASAGGANPHAKALELLAAERRSEGEGIVAGALERRADAETPAAVTTATASGLPGMPSVPTGAAPNVKLPSAAPAPSIAAAQGLTPALPKAVAQAKTALEHADHHPVGVPEIGKALQSEPRELQEALNATYGEHPVVAETPQGKVHQTPAGPVYVPHEKVQRGNFYKLTGQTEAGASLPGRKR